MKKLYFKISPLDGRYAAALTEVAQLFDETQLNQTRLVIEIAWLKTLAEQPKIKEVTPLSKRNISYLDKIIQSFDARDARRIKKLEHQTKHDLKAIEYFLREKFTQYPSLKQYREFIHFGCTSDDINNLSYAITIGRAKTQIILPQLTQLIARLKQLAKNHAATPMLSRTHGQRATPTTFGKEMANFAYRLTRQVHQLAKAPMLGKFNGAVGNFNALTAAYPKLDWQIIVKDFVKKFQLQWNPYTTQIEPHDWIVEHCNIIRHCNNILIGLCRDIWGYIALDYLKQQNRLTEIGSSVMPHKINPIDFENAEGNLGIANTLLAHFSDKLPITRWQRDLSDSTVMRNLGVAMGHTHLAYQAIDRGLSRLTVDQTKLLAELDQHWEVLAEAIQTVMRRFKIKTPYEQLKKLTGGKTISPMLLHSFVEKLAIPHAAKKKLLKLTPKNYLGLASELAKKIDYL